MNSWDGGRSQVDNDIFQERREKKRMWSDEYEEELDTGKVGIHVDISTLCV